MGDKNTSVGVGVSIGALKEIWDKISKKGNPEFLDFVYTTFGVAVGYWVVSR